MSRMFPLAFLAVLLAGAPASAAPDDESDPDFDEDFGGPSTPKKPAPKGGKPAPAGGLDDDDGEDPAEPGLDGDDEDPGDPGDPEDSADEDPDDLGPDDDEGPPDDDLGLDPAPKKGSAAGAPKPPEPAKAGKLKVAVSDKTLPLGDNFPAEIIAADADTVVVELPVLVARKGAEHKSEDFWLVAEVLVGGRKVGEARHQVTKAGVADLSPTLVWFKVQAPVMEAEGAVELRVSRVGKDGAAKTLFSRSAKYKL
jgi:hypothetical protein